MEQKMCSICKKSSSEYYELLLQIRFKYFEDAEEIKKNIIKKLESEKIILEINKFEELKSGFDIYFKSHSMMNSIFSLFQKDYLCDEKRSKKLSGRDKLISKDIYRYTQSLTLINLKKNNIIRVKGIEYKIKSINNNKVLILLNAENGQKSQESYSIIKDYLQVKGFDY